MASRFDATFNESDRPLSPAELRRALETFDIVCPTITDRLSAELLAPAGMRCRLLANYGAGFEHIDLIAAANAGIAVSNTPDALTEATAELALLLMLSAARRSGEGERQLRTGRWAGWYPTHLVGRSLRGHTLGLVGFGRIARAFASLAKTALDMRIFYTSRSRVAPDVEAALDATFVEDLAALAPKVDVLSLHIPGGASTHHLIDAAMLARMRSDAILINTARGSIVDEAALATALSSRTIAAAGLDVYEKEPHVPASLLACDNAVLMPHLGSATREARTAMGLRALANMEAWFSGMPIPDRVA